MSVKTTIRRMMALKAYEYLDQDPKTNLPKLLDWTAQITPARFNLPISTFHHILANPECNWYQLIAGLWTEVDEGVRKTLFNNFVLNSVIAWTNKRQAAQENYGCPVPWAIVINLGDGDNALSFDELDNLILQGVDLGTYMYIFSGKSPMLFRNEIIALSNKYNECLFACFTEASQIDEAFADELLRVGNLIPAIRLDHSSMCAQESTDGMTLSIDKDFENAVNILKNHHLLYGTSCRTTQENAKCICKEEFFDEQIALGIRFCCFFPENKAGMSFIPVTKQDDSLKEMYQTIHDYRKTKQLFTLTFQNDGEDVSGYIAGGRTYISIGPEGEIEPSIVDSGSGLSLRRQSLRDALCAPVFAQYVDVAPFGGNCTSSDNRPA